MAARRAEAMSDSLKSCTLKIEPIPKVYPPYMDSKAGTKTTPLSAKGTANARRVNSLEMVKTFFLKEISIREY